MTLARWSLFAWGSLACGVMAYFAGLWFVDPPDPAYNEYLFGAWIGLALGLPAFVALPFLAFLGRPPLAARPRLVLLAPSIGAAIAMSVVAALGSA